MLQITNKSNLPWPYLTYLATPTLTLPEASFPIFLQNKDLHFYTFTFDAKFFLSYQNLAKQISGLLKYTSAKNCPAFCIQSI